MGIIATSHHKTARTSILSAVDAEICHGNPQLPDTLTGPTRTMADPSIDSSSALSGGFLPPHATSLPSPAPSGASTTRPSSGLPHPRAHPLRAGSAKEEKIRMYVENQLMTINRRFVKKFEPPRPGDEIIGYRNIGELCKDIEGLLDVLWLSGTRKNPPPLLHQLPKKAGSSGFPLQVSLRFEYQSSYGTLLR